MEKASHLPVFAEFDDDFFAAYEQELQSIDPVEQAAVALHDILQVKNDDQPAKSYAEIRDASRAFFANVWVKQDELLMSQAALQFAMACMDHPHGAELSRDVLLGSVFDRGSDLLGNDEASHDHEHEIDPKTGKKIKKKKRSSWLSLLLG